MASLSTMFANEGLVDRFMRVVLGIALVAMVFFGPKSLWGLVGIVPLLTGVIGFCPLYRVIGLSTHPRAHTSG